MNRLQSGAVYDDLVNKLEDVNLASPEKDEYEITLHVREIMLIRKILKAYATIWELSVQINDFLAMPWSYFLGRVEGGSLKTGFEEMKLKTSNARGRAERIRDIVWEDLNFGE